MPIDEWLESVSATDVMYKSPPDRYSDKEIKMGMKLYHYLSDSTPIKIDLSRAVGWMGREWRDVFTLYSHGFTLRQISQYWVGVKQAGTISSSSGDKIVTALVKRLRFYLGLREESVPLGNDKE